MAALRPKATKVKAKPMVIPKAAPKAKVATKKRKILEMGTDDEDVAEIETREEEDVEVVVKPKEPRATKKVSKVAKVVDDD